MGLFLGLGGIVKAEPAECPDGGWPIEIDIPLVGGDSVYNKCLTFEEYVNRIYQFVTLIVGLLAVGMFMIGAFQYLTSAGNTSATAEAKKTMFSALAGIIIVISAFLILRVINIDLTQIRDLKAE